MVVIDDHRLLTDGIRVALRDDPDLRLLDVAHNVKDGLTVVGLRRPDVVLVDARLPDGDGIAAIGLLREQCPDATMVVLTGDESPGVRDRAIRAGADGILSKALPLNEILEQLRLARRGTALFSSADVRRALARDEGGALTPREIEVLHQLAEAASTRDIARELGVSMHTVRNHIRNLTRKLQASTRLEAVVNARNQGLLGSSTADR